MNHAPDPAQPKRGRPRGTRDEAKIREEALWYAFTSFEELTGTSLPAAMLAKLFADPNSRTSVSRMGSYAALSIETPSTASEQQFRDQLKYAGQRRSGSHGPNYLENDDTVKRIVQSGFLALCLLMARTPPRIRQFATSLEYLGWPAEVIRKLEAIPKMAVALDLAKAELLMGGSD